jgi:hypothetical protein
VAVYLGYLDETLSLRARREAAGGLEAR